MKHLFALLCVLAGAAWISAPERPPDFVWAAPDQHRFAELYLEEERSLVQVIENGRTLWETTCCPGSGNVQAFWSDDSQQLALLEIEGSRLTVWNARYARQYTGSFLEGEGALDMLFTPGKLRMRIAPVFGNYDANLGELYELDLGTGEATLVNGSAAQLF